MARSWPKRKGRMAEQEPRKPGGETGIRAKGARNRIEDNILRGHRRGIEVEGPDNVVRGNFADALVGAVKEHRGWFFWLGALGAIASIIALILALVLWLSS